MTSATPPADHAHVRFAQPQDYTQVCELDRVPDEMVTRQLIADQRYVIAELDGRVIGLIRVEYIWTVIPYMGLIWIEPQYRNRGLSGRLLGLLCDHLRHEGHKTLFSSSQANEPTPQAWHRHVGFVDSGRIEGINQGGVDEVVFRLSLIGNGCDK